MKRWLIYATALLAIAGALTAAVIVIVARRLDPYVRQQAEAYLSERFHSEVSIGSIHISADPLAHLRAFVFRRHGVATVSAENIVLRHRGRRDVPPLFVLGRAMASVDAASLFGRRKVVNFVALEGMEITLPPGRDRDGGGNGPNAGILFESVEIHNATLTILPLDAAKRPLRFELKDVHLESAAQDREMRYQADLINPRPPGAIHAEGSFGPWVSESPGDTPLSGHYRFDNADLSVFSGIAGTLRSTGEFQGTLSAIHARGEAVVPDFRLKSAGNRVPLHTTFEVGVDGTNGNTELKPVSAVLGETRFSTSGIVVKHEGDAHRTLWFDVDLPSGRLTDVLRLAMKGPPIMEGTLRLRTQIGIPPLDGPIKHKLALKGRFEVMNGRFLRSQIQARIDELSRRGQGEPKNADLNGAVHRMEGNFRMARGTLAFDPLRFSVPGADVAIAGTVDTVSGELDFQGTLKLEARMSQTLSGWKRWAAKPLDPFFAKQGAGTFLNIKVDGTTADPKFGLNRKGNAPRRTNSN